MINCPIFIFQPLLKFDHANLMEPRYLFPTNKNVCPLLKLKQVGKTRWAVVLRNKASRLYSKQIQYIGNEIMRCSQNMDVKP